MRQHDPQVGREVPVLRGVEYPQGTCGRACRGICCAWRARAWRSGPPGRAFARRGYGRHAAAEHRQYGIRQYATYHLGDESFFHRLARVPYIINTSRGEVVDNEALLQALLSGRVKDAVIDVWENEPHLNLELLQRVFIGTPHIAGYSADGKVNADNMVIDALCQHFGLPHPGKISAPSLPAVFQDTGSPLDYYNPMEDSQKLKNHPSNFEFLRNHYPLRREKLHN